MSFAYRRLQPGDYALEFHSQRADVEVHIAFGDGTIIS